MAAEGVIHDLGYRSYDGPRLGRGYIVRALAGQSLRAAFGLGRGAKAKVLPILAFAGLCLPAIINAFVVARGGDRQFSYDTYQSTLRVVVMTVFVAAQAPELVSRDLRSHVLPLYFARPLGKGDYPLAKFTAFTAACLAMIELPLVFLYLGTIASAHGGSAVWSETKALIPGLAIGVMWAVALAVISLLLASLSGRRGYATGTVAIFLFITWTVARLLIGVDASHVGAARVAGLLSPFTLLDGVRQWLGGTTPGEVPAPGGLGAVYLIVLLALLGAAGAGLVTRYRKVSVS